MTPSKEDRERFQVAFAEARKGKDFLPALEAAAAATLGASDWRPMVHAVANLATDFGMEKKLDVSSDSMVIVRLMEGYYRLAAELAQSESTEINLPFLTATGAGPQHLQRTITRFEFAALTSAPKPAAKQMPAARQMPVPAPNPKKKGWFW